MGDESYSGSESGEDAEAQEEKIVNVIPEDVKAALTSNTIVKTSMIKDAIYPFTAKQFFEKIFRKADMWVEYTTQ